jgi:hypothetical protein
VNSRFAIFESARLLLAAVTSSANNSVVVSAEAKREMQVTDKDRNDWAFRPLSEVRSPRSGVSPVDAFLFARVDVSKRTFATGVTSQER